MGNTKKGKTKITGNTKKAKTNGCLKKNGNTQKGDNKKNCRNKIRNIKRGKI